MPRLTTATAVVVLLSALCRGFDDAASPDVAERPPSSSCGLSSVGAGGSLQLACGFEATVTLTAAPEDHALLASLGDDLKFVFITSAIDLVAGSALQISVKPSSDAKCERCWHYRSDVGSDAAHPTICGRCTSNLHGDGESRAHA